MLIYDCLCQSQRLWLITTVTKWNHIFLSLSSSVIILRAYIQNGVVRFFSYIPSTNPNPHYYHYLITLIRPFSSSMKQRSLCQSSPSFTITTPISPSLPLSKSLIISLSYLTVHHHLSPRLILYYSFLRFGNNVYMVSSLWSHSFFWKYIYFMGVYGKYGFMHLESILSGLMIYVNGFVHLEYNFTSSSEIIYIYIYREEEEEDL